MIGAYTVKLRLLMIAACFGLFAAGCSSNADVGQVSGTVTLDGQPLATGLIRFVPVDGQSPTADTAISDGAYSATVPPGDKRVEITSAKVVGKRKAYDTPDSPMIDITGELLPARYNTRTELTLTVVAGDQQKEFALESAK